MPLLSVMAESSYIKEFLEKAANYCSWQERSETDIRRKLQSWEVPEASAEKILDSLRENNFFDNERFARMYASGKHRQNKWGWYKIRQGLYTHGIDEQTALEALQQIPDDEYLETLRTLMKKKMAKQHSTGLKEKSQVFNYLKGKGYESDKILLLWEEESGA